MRVFLVHGMGRSRASMLLLGRRLARAGHAPSYFGYRVSRDLLEVIGRDLAAHVRATVRADREGLDEAAATAYRYAVVGHSLGSIVTRVAAPQLEPGFDRFVMLAPPNQPPAMARAIGDNPIYRALTRDAGRRLQDEDFYARLPKPGVRTLVVAGNAAPRVRWLPFGAVPSDGILAVHETELEGADRVEVPAIHTFVMNHPDTTRAIHEFLTRSE